jgi:hypothetical protein
MIVNDQLINYDLTDLCKIMSKHGSDKSCGWHNYTLVYDYLFKNIKSNAEHFFELGIGTINSGASLKGWKQYFSKANIYGADILYEVLFTDHRIQTFHCDQLSKSSIEKLWSYFKNTELDVIIEDGLHTYHANICFLENSLHKVKKGGYYIIEDVQVSELHKYESYFQNCKLNFQEHQILNLYNPGNKYDNVLIIIKK